MARLCITNDAGQVQPIACNACGGQDFFAHNKRAVTCNKCGRTHIQVKDVSVLLEQVVMISGG